MSVDLLAFTREAVQRLRSAVGESLSDPEEAVSEIIQELDYVYGPVPLTTYVHWVEDLILQYRYPDCYVAYCDVPGIQDVWPVTYHVAFVTPDWVEMCSFRDALPPVLRARYEVRRIHNPEYAIASG